jgi:hypothetical protein
MGLGGILQELKTEGVLGFYHDYRSGRLYDYSGNGNSVSLNSNFIFTKEGLNVINTSTLQIPFSATWAWNTQVTILLFYKIAKSLLTTAASNYGSYHATPPTQAMRVGDTLIGWSDGVNLRILATDANIYRCLGVSMLNNAIGTVYGNGVLLGSLSGTSVVQAPTAGDLLLDYPQLDPSWRWLARADVVVKRVLTATEHARLYGQIENMQWNTKGLTPGPMMP